MASWKQSKILKVAPLVATLLLILCEVLAHYFPSWYQIESQTSLTVISYAAGAWFEGFAVISWIACFVCSVVSLFTKTKWGFLSFLAFLICPVVAFSTGIEQVAESYNEQGQLTDADGSEYHLFSNSFFQGNKLLIAKVKDRAGARTDFIKLATASNSGDANHLLLIRPQSKPGTSPLTLTKDRLLIGADGATYAFVAYDLKRQVDLSISKVSPFALIGPKDIPNHADFAEALKGDMFSVSDGDVLKSELKNANPTVREMAKQLLAKASSKADSKP